MLGADVFGIRLNTARKKGPYMIPLSSGNKNQDSIKNTALYGCSKDTKSLYAGSYCGGLIQLNNWKIPDDYPVRF